MGPHLHLHDPVFSLIVMAWAPSRASWGMPASLPIFLGQLSGMDRDCPGFGDSEVGGGPWGAGNEHRGQVTVEGAPQGAMASICVPLR